MSDKLVYMKLLERKGQRNVVILQTQEQNFNGYITKMFNVYAAEHNRIRGMPQCLELFCVNCVINRDVIPREACVKQYKLAVMDII